MGLFSGKSARNTGIWAYNTAQDAKNEGQSQIDQAQSNSLNSLGQGYTQARDDATTYYNQGSSRLDTYANNGEKANNAYTDSLGLNGQDGYDNTVATYRESPGYQYQVDQALDQTARKASATGALGSGNTLQALSDRAQNMADADYSEWQNQLKGLSDSGQAAATQQGSWDTQLGNTLASLSQSQGRDESQVYQNYSGQSQNNLWNATNTGINAVTNASKQAQGNVASGYNFGVNAGGSLINALGLYNSWGK